MVFKSKISVRIILSAISTEFYSFKNMKKPNFSKKSFIIGPPSKRATWEGKSQCFDKSW